MWAAEGCRELTTQYEASSDVIPTMNGTSFRGLSILKTTHAVVISSGLENIIITWAEESCV
jgi:hypothetical protein